MDSAFIQERITTTKTLITTYEEVVTALGADGGTQSYTIDTGQTRQTVTRADIPRLNELIDGLYNRLATLEARFNGSGTLIGRPGW